MNIPTWALKQAAVEDRKEAKRAHRQDMLDANWPDKKTLKVWAKEHGWPTPWLFFDDAFIGQMLENDENFALALNESGIELIIPKKRYLLTAEKVSKFDALYEERSSQDQPVGWDTLVAELREIRQAVEAGVKVEIEGTEIVLKSWQGFYDWAHGRYPLLEEGYDSWIGDDFS